MRTRTRYALLILLTLTGALALASSALSINPVTFDGQYQIHEIYAATTKVCNDGTRTPIPAHRSPNTLLTVLGGYLVFADKTRYRITSATNSVMGVAKGALFAGGWSMGFSYFRSSGGVNVSGTSLNKPILKPTQPGAPLTCVEITRGIISGIRVKR